MRHPLPSQQRLQELFTYRDGQLIRNIATSSNTKVGEVAGNRNTRYHVVRVDGVQYVTHRIIFKLMLNIEPENVDHIDGDSFNNRIENLRACSHSENMANRKTHSNTPIARNICKRGDRFHVYVSHNTVKHTVGNFATVDEAIQAATNFRKSLHGEFFREEATCV